MFLRHKVWCINHSSQIRTFGLRVLGVYAILITILLANLAITGRDASSMVSNPIVSVMIWSIVTMLPLVSTYCSNAAKTSLTDFDKLRLCLNLKTGFSKCDTIINNIIKSIRNRKSRFIEDFTYKDTNIGTIMLDEYNQPYVHIYDELGYQMPSAKDYLVYNSREGNSLYLIECLYTLTDSEEDCIELEKTFFQFCT